MSKTWREKLEEQRKKLPKIVIIPKKLKKRFGKGKMLIPKPLDVDALIQNEKFPGGIKTQANYLKKEGFTILPNEGKKSPKAKSRTKLCSGARIKDFEKYLIKL